MYLSNRVINEISIFTELPNINVVPIQDVKLTKPQSLSMDLTDKNI